MVPPVGGLLLAFRGGNARAAPHLHLLRSGAAKGVVDAGEDVGSRTDVDSNVAHLHPPDGAAFRKPKLVYARTPTGALEIPFGL